MANQDNMANHDSRDRAASSAAQNVDVLVVGAGPTGCAAALSFARRGAKVLLIEGQPKAAKRFAGEWLHPPGARALAQLGVDTKKLTRSSGTGFVLFAEGEDPVELPYSRGQSIARVHHELVEELRSYVREHDQIDYRENFSFSGFSGESALVRDNATRIQNRVVAQRIIGADGRQSRVRAALGAPESSAPISYMMGVDLHDCQLPFEGLGHVVAGGPGPALLYRVDENMIRACLDVPNWLGQSRKKEDIFEAFEPVLPASLREAFARGIETSSAWAATRFQARTFFGKGRVWLAGDAVGHLHPVTGMGMTLGILDGVAAAECATLEQYADRRQSYVVELLTKVLYHVVQRKDASATRVRHGLFEMLRKNPGERLRTMRILTGEDERRKSFVTAFVKASGYSIGARLRDSVPPGKSPAMGLAALDSSLLDDLQWLKWPASALVPGAKTGVSRMARNSFFEPLPTVKTYGLSWPPKASNP